MPDPCSLSNFESCLVTHLHWIAHLNFDSSTITAQTTVTAKVVKEGTDKLVLDTRGLDIKSVKLGDAAVDIAWEGKEEDPTLGRGLCVALPEDKRAVDSVVDVTIAYNIGKDAASIQWLTPSQTAGGKHPYLFTQCQAIHARAMLPCQDTPSVKATYSAEITVPAPLVAVMSALGNGDAGVEVDGKRTYKFKQPVAMCAYLIALAVGDLVSKEIGPRSKVWSEPAQLESVAYEFAETEDFIRAGEELLTPYVWGQYDVICLPPSFPYGGMENPCLTFVTPTLLAGDRSLADVICHEIAHSWTGNLVTNLSWEHFWMNEGFTMYVQRSIMRKLIIQKGGDGDAFFDFDAQSGRKRMGDDIARFGADHPYTKLVVDHSGGVDPDDVFSSVPYEKGFSLIHYVQQKAGGHDPFNVLLKEYIAKFSYSHVTSEDFKNMYMEKFGDKEGVAEIDWDKWFNAPGYPPALAELDTSILSGCTKLADAWTEGDGSTTDDFAGFNTGQARAFLDTMLNRQEAGESKVAIDKALLEKMEEVYKLTSKMNSEIRFRWQMLNIRAKRSEILEHVTKFLVEQGRMKFVRPLYRALYAVDEYKKLAQDTFTANRDIYHPIASKMLAADLKL